MQLAGNLICVVVELIDIFSDRCQDPTMVKPDIPGSFCKTTLVQVYAKWFVIDLCERLDGLVKLDFFFDG